MLLAGKCCEILNLTDVHGGQASGEGLKLQLFTLTDNDVPPDLLKSVHTC
jgi:hypothetical protein